MPLQVHAVPAIRFRWPGFNSLIAIAKARFALLMRERISCGFPVTIVQLAATGARY